MTHHRPLIRPAISWGTGATLDSHDIFTALGKKNATQPKRVLLPEPDRSKSLTNPHAPSGTWEYLPIPSKVNHNRGGERKIIFFSKWVIRRFHVNLPGCILLLIKIQAIHLNSVKLRC